MYDHVFKNRRRRRSHKFGQSRREAAPGKRWRYDQDDTRALELPKREQAKGKNVASL